MNGMIVIAILFTLNFYSSLLKYKNRVMRNNKQCCRSANHEHFCNVLQRVFSFLLLQTFQPRAEEERAGGLFVLI